jgi:hypothetical protein
MKFQHNSSGENKIHRFKQVKKNDETVNQEIHFF